MDQTAMTPDTWAVIGTGLAILAAIFAMAMRLDRRMDRMEDRMNAEFKDLRKEMTEQHRELADRVSGLGERVAGVEKALELATDLLRDLLVRRNTPGANPEQAD